MQGLSFFCGTGTASGGGSGFSDSDWASELNRPTLSGNVLTWVGPLGGGVNNGTPVQQSRTLTSASGMTATTNQVIEGKLLDGLFIPNGVTGVTFRQCAIVDSNNVNGSLILVGTGGGHVFEDFYINGNKEYLCGFNSLTPDFSWGNSIIRRANLMGCENNITGNSSKLTIEDIWTHGAGNKTNPLYDADLIELYGGDGNIIRRSVLDSRDCDTGTFNSAINCSGTSGSTVSNTTIDSCLFIGGNYNAFILCLDDTNGPVTGVVMTNNGIYQLDPGATYRRNDSSVGVTANSGNYTAATLTAKSGTLINGGSGQI